MNQADKSEPKDQSSEDKKEDDQTLYASCCDALGSMQHHFSPKLNQNLSIGLITVFRI